MQSIPNPAKRRQLPPQALAFLARYEAKTGRRFAHLDEDSPELTAAADQEPKWTRPEPEPPPAPRARPGRQRKRSPDSRRARAERVDKARARARRKDSALLAKLEREIRARGGHAVGLRVVRSHVWSMCSHILADRSGRAGRLYLRRCPNKPFVGAVMRAAFGELDTAGRPRGRVAWCDMRARRIVAVGLAMLAISKRSHRAGQWNACVLGIPRGAFCALLADPYETRAGKGTPATTTLYGTHKPDATAETGQVGYIVALREAGALYRQQLPKGQGLLCETGYPSGYPPNRYWLLTPEPEKVHDDADRYRLAMLAAGVFERPELAPELDKPPRVTATPPPT